MNAFSNRITWSNYRMHLIGTEDMDPNNFDFEPVAGCPVAVCGQQDPDVAYSAKYTNKEHMSPLY